MEASLRDMLLARDRRAALQRELVGRIGRPLICFTMNIPGPVKTDPLIEQGFALGRRRLEAQLRGSGIPVLYSTCLTEHTGCEAIYVVEGEPEHLKALCMQIEEADPLGRLLDLDVLDKNGDKISRQDRRSCLLCGQPAQVCGRSRAHSLAQLQARVREILVEAICREDREVIAAAAVKSLLYEVAVTPKPGLVDRLGPGSHEDMDIFTFLGSAAVLQPYFARCAGIGQTYRDAPAAAVFSRLRYPGKLAEDRMYRETAGVNTHKGAIFSLGLLCAAAGMTGPRDRTPDRLLDLCGEMTRGLTEAELGKNARTAGERAFRDHGITGVRGQAQAGFPAVGKVGLPVLRQGLARGLSLNHAAMAALLHIFTHTDDTNLIARSDLQTHRTLTQIVRQLLEETPFPAPEQVAALDRQFTGLRLSPGGSADLLSLTLFLHFLCPQEP